MSTYTSDHNKWYDLEYEFAGFASNALLIALGNTPEVDDLADQMYEPFLEYARGLDQDDFVRLIKAIKPEMLEMVKV